MKNLISKYKKTLLFIVLVSIALGISAFLYVKSKQASNTSVQTITYEVKKGDITFGVETSGQIQTANYLAVTTSVNGIVKQVYVKEGDKVVTGQKLMEVTLDSEGEKSRISSYAAYLKAKNSVDEAKNGLISKESSVINAKEAFDDVKESNSYQAHDERTEYKLAENTYASAKNSYDLQKASISQLELALNVAWLDYQTQSPIITAPTDGTIANIVAVEGIKIENSVSERSIQTVASIKKEGTPIATVNVNELDINKIKVGQKVDLTLNSIADTHFTGSVVGIDRIGSVSSGVTNYPLIIKFDKDNEGILPNMGVDATVIIDQKSKVLTVPSAAIKTRRGQSSVNVLTSEGIKNVEITIGLSDGTNTEVVSGLSEGDKVQVDSFSTSGFTSTDAQNQVRGVSTFGTFGGSGGNFQRRQ